jgi:Recombinase
MPKKFTNCPSWLTLSEDRASFIFMPDRAEIVRKIFELSIAGLGGYTIAKQLNNKRVPAFGLSKKWDQSTIHNMLRNRATVGEHQPKRSENGREYPVGDPVPGYYPAVIEESVFQAAQDARQQNLSEGRGRKGRVLTNLFGGIATCAYCAKSVQFYSNGNAKSLVCAGLLNGRVVAKQTDGQSCYRKAWSCRDFENSFFQFILSHQSDPATEPSERTALVPLVDQIKALAGPDLYEARLTLRATLKKSVSLLKIASAGLNPVAEKPSARIIRDVPERCFEVGFFRGPPVLVMAKMPSTYRGEIVRSECANEHPRGADEVRFDVRQPVGPAVRAHCDVVRAAIVGAIEQHLGDAGCAQFAEGDFFRGGRHGTGHCTSGQLSLTWCLSLNGRVPRLPPGTFQVLPAAPV